jgi:hypothetical protein
VLCVCVGEMTENGRFCVERGGGVGRGVELDGTAKLEGCEYTFFP